MHRWWNGLLGVRWGKIESNTRLQKESCEDDMGARKGVRCGWTLGAFGQI